VDEEQPLALPRAPIDRIIGPLARFLHIEAASGVVLLGFTAAALALANSPFADEFLDLWKIPVGVRFGEFAFEHSLKHWINDGLMAIFFFVIGLEVKRELAIGELRDARRAALPLAAAIGGMVAPAAIYLAFQAGAPAEAGWGIPMATDIAFVVGCMAVLGRRIPHGLRVLLLSLAIADDIGAILVIAIGYTDAIDWTALAYGLAGIAAISGLARVGVRSFVVYAMLGVGVWFAFHESGIHATIAGVVIGLMTPARQHVSEIHFGRLLESAFRITSEGGLDRIPDRAGSIRRFQQATREVISPLEYLENLLHPWVGFVIMPLFAFANAGVPFSLSDLADPVALAIAVSLVLGKPLGIVAACALAVRLGWASLPSGVGWGVLTGAGLLAGIGFTMALFIAGLALDGAALNAAKVGVLVGSAIAAVAGVGLLVAVLRPPPREDPEIQPNPAD
jgi:NhaA family Na+:H+ antiporter